MEFVFALPMRESSVNNAQNLVQLLRLSHFDINDISDQAEICTHITRTLKRVCIVLDGLDEVKLQNCSPYVRSIIEGKALRDVNLIVTSRPSTEVLELDRKHPFNRRIEVVGFRRQDLSKYVRKLLSEDDATDVMAQVDAHPQLAAFMQTPINCAQACLMYSIRTHQTSHHNPSHCIAHSEKCLQVE